MSRNSNLRKIAENLPKYPKLINGKPQYDSAGNIIYNDHFRVLKDIEEEMAELGHKRNSKEVAKQFNKYVVVVLEYNKQRSKKEGNGIEWFWYVAIIMGLILVYKITTYFN